MGASTQWKGFLSFGLISAPVKLFVAARTERIGFNQLHSCGCRINQETVCRTCNTKVERADLLKGYEVEKGSYVKFTADELEAIEPKSSKTMQVDRFVDLSEVDPIYFDASYFMAPDGEAGQKVYQLLYETMKDIKKGAIVSITMHGREHMAIIRPFKAGLVLHTLFYESEVREITEFGGFSSGNTMEAERNMAAMLLNSLTKPFDAAAYHDEYRSQVLALIEAKKSGAAAPKPTSKPAPVMDLMAQLQASLAAATPKPEPAAPKKAKAKTAKG